MGLEQGLQRDQRVPPDGYVLHRRSLSHLLRPFTGTLPVDASAAGPVRRRRSAVQSVSRSAAQSVQFSERSTALAHWVRWRVRVRSSIDGTHRSSSTQCARSSSVSFHTPAASPAA